MTQVGPDDFLKTIGELFMQVRVMAAQLEAANQRIKELEPKDDKQSRDS